MSEINELTPEETQDTGQDETQDTGQDETEPTPGTEPETPGTDPTPEPEPTPPASTSVINLAIESVMDLIDGLNLFATITRGALGIGNSLCCEISPSTPQTVFLDKNLYITLTLALNGKHDDLQVLSDALNNIMDTLSRKKTYTSGNGFQIVDIVNGNLPRVIGREDNNSWVMACDLVIKIFRKDAESNG